MSNEKQFDEFLNINTLVESENFDPVNDGDSLYEVTYYNDLVTVFNAVEMEPEDTLVDYGCGLGRVLFYANSRHYCNCVGIENNADIFKRLMKNVSAYQSKFLEQEERMHFHNVEAQDYEVRDQDNFFYFFNPFSAQVFKQVVANIVASAKKNPRDIYLVVYYPTFAYQRVIKDANVFIQKEMIKLSGYKNDPEEKALVYYLSKYLVR